MPSDENPSTETEGSGDNGRTNRDAVRPNFGSAAEKRKIAGAVAALAAATNAGDANRLCAKVYARGLVHKLNEQGGCVSETAKRIKPYGNYKIVIKKIQFVSDNDANVAADATFTYNGDAQKANPPLDFKLENGAWKYYVRGQ